jgi:rhodanese-related sulfurtransferase
MSNFEPQNNRKRDFDLRSSMDAKPFYPNLATCVCIMWLLVIAPELTHAGHEFDETVDTIKPEQVRLILNAGEKLVLVDLRPVKDFKEKRLPGARSIPIIELEKRFSEIPKTGRVVLYCGCPPGGADESYSFLFLREKGYRNVSVMETGFSHWVKQNYLTEAGGR